jgi:hypothetical protein
MNTDHYTYRVTWSAEDGEHLGPCAEFPPLSWLAAEPEDALSGIRAVVVECGPACWPDEPPRAKPGDVVLVAKYAGFIATDPKSGEPYRFVNDRDIFAGIQEAS